MSDEERQRQMDFIVAALARLTASTEAETQANREHDAQVSKRMDRLERVLKLAIRTGQRRLREQDERINALIDSQVETLEIARRNSEAIDSQAERSREQDERINAFVNLQAERSREQDERISALIDSQAASSREQDKRINALIDAQVETSDIARRNSEAINSQAERSREQDERINAFVNSVERLVETMQQSAAKQNNGGGSNVQP